MASGSLIVLTADSSLFTSYGGSEFAGFFACLPKRLLPSVLQSYLYPKVPSKNGRAAFAPYALRKIEAYLLASGFSESQVLAAQPSDLSKVVGSQTRAVGITSVDPCGKSPVTHTVTSVTGGGNSATASLFESIVKHPSIQKNRSHLQIIVGGPGAWQLTPEETKRLGIDCVVVGEADSIAKDVFNAAVKGERLPQYVFGSHSGEAVIETIVNPSRRGSVEITRGCGRGCQFCAPTQRKWISFSKEHILKEVKINKAAGINVVPMVTDDGLRYGSPGLDVNSEAVLGLFRSVLSIDGMKRAELAHASFSSVVAAPTLLGQLSDLCGYCKETPFLGPQIGLETGSVRLIEKFMCGKPKPGKAQDWPEIVVQATKILNNNYWYPCTTLILGLPEETEDDVLRTLELVDRLKGSRQWLLPLFFTAMGESSFKNQTSHTLEAMTQSHWDLLFECWAHSIDFSKYATRWLFPSSNIFATRITKKFTEGIIATGEKYLERARNNPELMVKTLHEVDFSSRSQTLKHFFKLMSI